MQTTTNGQGQDLKTLPETIKTILVFTDDKRNLFTFHDLSIGESKRTGWIQKHTPCYVVFVLGDNKEPVTLELETSTNKQGRECLTGFKSLDGLLYQVIFTVGTDPDRPSYNGTITTRIKKSKDE